MATLADAIGAAAASASDARDAVNAAWKLADAAFGTSPAKEALVECCRVWVTGTNAVADFTDSLGRYTQAIATAYCAADHTMAGGATAMHTQDDLPKPGTTYHYDPNIA
jgi:hypothetical protein